MACFVSPAQRIVVASLNFNLLRVLVIAGWTRILLREETTGFTWRRLDWVLIAYAVVRTTSMTLLFGDAAALKLELGSSFDTIGMYFMFRCLVRNWDDLATAIRGFVLASVPVAAFFLLEYATGRNPFAVFGYVSAATAVREGRLRCQGAFAHPILAGCFWASLMPLIAARWWAGARERSWAVVGLVCSALVVVCCASSTPLMGVLFAILGGLMYVVRHHMRKLRWGLIVLLVCLHMVMKAPVWHLISRIDLTNGNTAYHRYKLIDCAVNRLGEWWLIGTTSTAHWDDTGLLRDVTNQYILDGVRGGLLTMVLLIAAITLAFGTVGRLWRVQTTPGTLSMSWALGVSLFVHCTSFMSVSYFGQIIVVWYLLLAMVGSLDATTLGRLPSPLPARVIPKPSAYVRVPVRDTVYRRVRGRAN
jgi:hypothetical protein